MDAKKCDRCGNFYGKYKGLPFIEGGGDDRYYCYMSIESDPYKKHFDLCPDCMEKLYSFLRNDDKEIDKHDVCGLCKYEDILADDCPCASCLTIHDGCEKSYYEPKEGT